MPVRKADAVWEGVLRSGKGRMKVGSGALDVPFTYTTRFEDEPGTNPEELIGAAEAGCFSMALSGNLERAGFKAERIHTTADVHLDRTDAGPTITRIVLNCEAKVPGADETTFQQQAEITRTGCPVARALRVELVLNAKLVK
jgi:osmotically inducible protein OsmC